MMKVPMSHLSCRKGEQAAVYHLLQFCDWIFFLRFVTACKGTSTLWMAGIWKVIGTTKMSIEINMQNNRGTQENEQYRKFTIFMNSVLCSLSNLLLEPAKFLELVGSSVCIRQALASASTYSCQEINPTCCREKEDKEASCSMDIVGCSSSTMKS